MTLLGISWPSKNKDVDEKMGILRDMIASLLARKDDILSDLEVLEIQPGRKRRAEVDHWLNTVKRKKDEFENLQSKAEGLDLQQYRRIETLTTEVQDLVQRGKFPDGLVLEGSMRLPFLVSILYGKMFALHKEKILDWVENSRNYVLGVYGMGGVGKTALLMHIYNQLLEDYSMSKTIFGGPYWVTVSNNCSLSRLQDQIAHEIQLKLTEDGEMKRAAELNNRLKNMKRVVLILDDIWEQVDLTSVGIPLGENNCKIILTTRKLEVCRRIGCKDSIMEVKSLSADEAWNLFIDVVENYEELSKEAKQIAKSVADECCCLPLAVITVGGSMRGVTDIPEWKNALDELRNPDRKHDDMEKRVLQILRFSFDRLNDDKMQQCFLTSVLYKEDQRIDRETLIELWLMEGLLDDAASRTEQENKGHTILNKLVTSCLLESVGKYCVKMHDLIRDMALMITQIHPRFIAKAGLQLREVPQELHWTEDVAKVSLMDNNIKEIPCDMSPRCPNLSVLLLNGNPLTRISQSFFVHMIGLKILNLSKTFIERLPDSLSDLENLQELLLDECSYLSYVPSLAKLTKLKTLHLPIKWGLSEAPAGLENLKCLEAMKCKWSVSQLAYYNTLIENWRTFNLCGYYHFLLSGHQRDYSARDHILSRGLFLDWLELGEMDPAPLIPRDTEQLNLFRCKSNSRGLVDILPSLGEVASTTLELLCIQDCKGMRVLLSVTTQTMFSYVKEIEIYRCAEIKVLFQFNLTEGKRSHLLPNLELLHIVNCNELEEVFKSSDNCTNFSILCLPKLRSLWLEGLPKLRSIYNRGILLALGTSRGWRWCTITEIRCPKLKFVFWPESLLCDKSTWKIIQTEAEKPEWWENVRRDHPEAAPILQSCLSAESTCSYSGDKEEEIEDDNMDIEDDYDDISYSSDEDDNDDAGDKEEKMEDLQEHENMDIEQDMELSQAPPGRPSKRKRDS